MEELKLSYHLTAFEGPLDLLLTLIAKNKINIYDIVISDLLDQYMEQIEIMQEENLDIASEFLEMASRLVYIKSASLLPKYEQEAQQLKQELSGQLIEYMECKRIAGELAKIVSFDSFIKEPSHLEYDLTYNRIHQSYEIAQAFESAVGRGKRRLPPSSSDFSGIVERKVVSVSSRIIHVIRTLRTLKAVNYGELFVSSRERSELVATFLAVLELVKGKRVRIEGDGDTANVKLIDKL